MNFEYKNYLFVPDVGKSYEEELNVVDLNLFSETSKPLQWDGHILATSIMI